MLVMYLRAVRGALRAQFLISKHPFDGMGVLLMGPLYAVVLFAILKNTGRIDLAGFALVAPFLISVLMQGIFQAGELFARDRDGQTLELAVATPAPYFVILASRVTVVMAISIPSLAVSWLIGWLFFGIEVTLHHPVLLLATLLLTLFAASGTAVAATATFCYGRSSRTFQSTVAYWPMMLLAGVIVPISLLPEWVQPFSRIVFLYWAADLLRDAVAAEPVDNVLPRLTALTGLGVAGTLLGAWMVNRMLDHHKREGTLGLS